MGKAYFITGTDTNAGKTTIACGLLESARLLGLTTLGLKPIATDSLYTADGLQNDDAMALMNAMTLTLPYSQINPFAFEAPIAPHIAAHESGLSITIEQLLLLCRESIMKHPNDLTLIEGAGGWRVPLNSHEMLSSLAKAMNIPVILVVGMKLGCINHSLLTAESIVNDGANLVGWIANQPDPNMDRYKENIETLETMLPCPCLGQVPWLEKTSITAVASSLDITSLL